MSETDLYNAISIDRSIRESILFKEVKEASKKVNKKDLYVKILENWATEYKLSDQYFKDFKSLLLNTDIEPETIYSLLLIKNYSSRYNLFEYNIDEKSFTNLISLISKNQQSEDLICFIDSYYKIIPYLNGDNFSDQFVKENILKNGVLDLFWLGNDSIKSDKEVILKVIEDSSVCFNEVNDSLKESKDFLIEILKINGSVLRFLSEEQKDDPVLVAAALSKEYKDESGDYDGLGPSSYNVAINYASDRIRSLCAKSNDFHQQRKIIEVYLLKSSLEDSLPNSNPNQRKNKL